MSFTPNTARQASTLPRPAVPVVNHSYVANTASLASDITVSELATLLKVQVSLDQASYSALPSNIQRHFKVA